MNFEFNFWEPLAGIGLFLFAMRQIESSLEHVSGRGFRNFIRRNTDTTAEGILSGTVVTAILQSSSLVGVMMLALVGAGVVRMRNALAVIFGANLGTTATGWIVATIGFKLNLDALAFPLIGVSGIIYVVTRAKSMHQTARFGLSLGLLLMGLQLMKSAVGNVDAAVDSSMLQSFGALEFFIFGALFSAIVQSSSATMAVALSALFGGVIDLPAAAAVAIGADLGTTSTVIIGAFNGSAAKKRVATGHFVFNLVTDVLALVIRMPLLGFIGLIGISDNLMALVAFHSLFNLLGLCLFIPFIGVFANYLEKLFDDGNEVVNRHLSNASETVPETALEAMELETAHLMQRVIRQNLLVFDPPIRIAKGRIPVGSLEDYSNEDTQRRFANEYQTTKQLEGEILGFSVQIQTMPLEEAQSLRIDRCQRAVREAVHASKSLKDIEADLQHFESSQHPTLLTYGQRFRDVLTEFYLALFAIRDRDTGQVAFENIVELNQLVHNAHDEIHKTIYGDVRLAKLEEADISSLLNANREMLASCQALITSIASYVLPPVQMETLERLPDSVL